LAQGDIVVAEKEVEEAPGDITYRVTSADPFRRRVYLGNKIVLPGELLGRRAGDDITLEVVNTASILSVRTPLGEQFVALGEEIEMDVDDRPGSDIILFVSDISSDSSQGVELRLLLKNGSLDAAASFIAPQEATPAGTVSVIFEQRRAFPFTLRVTFQDVCLLRQQVDNREKQENLYSNNAIVTMQANNGIRLWASNVKALTMQIIADGKTYDLAKETVSQVIARDIRWLLTPQGIYQLAVIELD
jgi:hypothetical protein